jgi:two-component system response regulator YesN
MAGLLVVDDEDIVRQTILGVVENSGLDLYPIEEARTGQEAVTVAQHLRPSIILMDVRMPGMNGLEATRAIRGLVPEAKVVILSAYDEFSFSQEALRLGAVDYLLKPVRPGTLVEALSRIHAQLQQEQETQNTAAEAMTRLEAALPLVESRLVHDMITRAAPPKEIADQLRDYLGVEVGWPAVMIVEVDSPAEMELGDDRSANGLLRDIVQRALLSQPGGPRSGTDGPLPGTGVSLAATGAALGGTGASLPGAGAIEAPRWAGVTPRWAGVTQDGPSTVVVVVSAEGELASIEALRALGHRVRAAVEAGAPVTATVTIGRRYPTLDLVHVSYAEALRAQWLKLSLGGNTVIHIDDARQVSSPARPYPVALERALIHQIRLGEFETCRDLLSQLVDYLLEVPYDPPEMVHTRFVELIALVSRAVIETGASSARVLQISHEQVMALNGLRSGPELKEWTLETLEALQEEVSLKAPRDQVVERALHFMDENFHRPDLQLKEVAAAAHVSPSHLAHLLRTQVGASYVKYMTLLRMEEGKRLLTETDLKVAVIAGRAGYDDPAYFYRVFRREVGVTPAQYRRRVRVSVDA